MNNTPRRNTFFSTHEAIASEKAAIQQSRYIAAIAQYLGPRSLVPNFRVTEDGTTFEYDFYDPKVNIAIKIFKHADEEEISQYADNSVEHFLILDGESLDLPQCEQCGRKCVHAIPIEVSQILTQFSVSLFLNDRLFKGEYDDNGAFVAWKPELSFDYEILLDRSNQNASLKRFIESIR